MDAVELPLPTAVVTKLTRSSGGGSGGGGTRVEMVTSQLESATSSSSFQPPKGNNCNVKGSRPAFWNKISDIDFPSQESQFSNLCNEEALIDHDIGYIENSFDMTSVSQSKQPQRNSGKASRSIGNCSRRSRVAYLEASFNVTGSLDVNVPPKELEAYPGKCSISEKIQTAKLKTISVKRSEKRNVKTSKSKCDSFSIKAGLSSFSSAAGGNNIFGVLYISKHDIYDVAKHLDEVSLNELLDDTYKRPQYVKDKQKNVENLNENILQSVKDACSVLQLRKSSQPQNLSILDVTYHQNASSCLPKSGTFGACKSDEYSSSSNKVKDSCSSFINQPYYMVEVPLLSPKEVLNRLTTSLHKDLDLLLLEIMKPTLMSKGNLGRSGLPSFPWSHISGGHYKTNPDMVKLATLNKSTCQGRWVKIGNSTLSFGDTTNFLADLGSLAYDQSIVPLRASGVCKMASNAQDGHAPGVLAAAQTLCEIATLFHKQDQSVTIRCPKKPSQRSLRANKLKFDYELEKTLFTSSKTLGPTKRSFATPIPSRLSKNPAKLRKLAPMERRSLPSKNRSAS